MTDVPLPHRRELRGWPIRGAGLAVGVLVVLVAALLLGSAADVIVAAGRGVGRSALGR